MTIKTEKGTRLRWNKEEVEGQGTPGANTRPRKIEHMEYTKQIKKN